MDKSARIYVAGVEGMVGSSIVRQLEKLGYTNVIQPTRAELDLFNLEEVKRFFIAEKPEYVVVAAARVGGIKANMAYPAEFLYENLLIQNNVIWTAHTHGVKKLLFLGSSCIYPVGCPQPMKEEYLLSGKLEPTNEGYALAKISGIKLCEYLYKEFGDVFISCMPTNIYGVNDNLNPDSSHVIPALMNRFYEAKLHKSSEVVIWGSGQSRREFLYVDDLASSVVWLLEHYEQVEFLNIGTGVDVSIRELAEMLKKITGYEGELVFDASKPDGMPKKLLDVSKINNLGWKHTIDLEEGLKIMYQWFLTKKEHA